MDRDKLLALIDAHHHYYDDDCGTDMGCSCNDLPRATEPADYEGWAYPAIEVGRKNHAEHLTDVILKELQNG